MARTTYAVDNPGKSPLGGNVTKRTGDTANGHYVLNSGATRLLLVNTGVGAASVYLWPGGHPSGAAGAVASGATQASSAMPKAPGVSTVVQTVTLAAAGSAGDAKVLGPFDTSVYGTTLYFDPAAGTTVSFYVFED